VDLGQDTSAWQPNQKVELGPFPVLIPPDLPEGQYRLTLGLAYAKSTPLGIRYVKVPYSNPEITGWTVGKVTVRARKSVSAAPEVQGFILAPESTLNKIFPEKEYLKTEIKDNISLSCAKNEVEGFQLLIIPSAADLYDVSIEATKLVNQENGAVLEKGNLSLYRVGFVKTRKPYYNTPRVGYWPDPLIPLKSNFTVKNNTVQPIWVNIHVPEDAVSGNYLGKILVKARGQKPKEAIIKLKVRDFSLSSTPHLKSAFDFYENLVDLRNPKVKNETDSEYKARLGELKRAYYLNMLSHRISPIHNVGNPEFLGRKDGRYVLDFKEFDNKVEFYRNSGQACFGIAQEWPYGFKGEWTDKWYGFTDAKVLEAVFKEYGKHLEEKGWLNNAYAYIFDETFHRVKEFTSLIHKGHPGVKNLLTMTPEEGFPDVDIWCVRINNLERPSVEKFKKLGKEIWTYVASPTRPYPSLNLDLPAIEHRIIPWICWKYGVKGLLYWCVNWWSEVNPWQDPMTYPEQNGNGSLYYPAPDGRLPIGSIRLEVLRDGMEDYEYLYILSERLKRLRTNPDGKATLIKQIENILAVPDDVVRTVAYHTYAPEEIYKLRDQIAVLIEAGQ
jgi:hypothetical protein